ncbi:hypothetical protein GFS31_05300 [Leptolyngbya sp. BL0902]|nr:hypothetical protein GFS31_05300 [Leptolyngbya sp. BL0902]
MDGPAMPEQSDVLALMRQSQYSSHNIPATIFQVQRLNHDGLAAMV